MYQYIIQAPTDATSVQITGTFDNWSKSLPEITSPPFEQTITLDEKQDIIFKFIINGNWTTLDLYPVVTDEHGNTNNIVHSEHLILVEEEKEGGVTGVEDFKTEEEGYRAESSDEPVVFAVADGDHTFDNVGKLENDKETVVKGAQVGNGSRNVTTKPAQDKKNETEHVNPHQSKQEPLVSQSATGANPTSSSSSFAAVSSPPTSSDFEHIDHSPSAEVPAINESKGETAADTSAKEKDTTVKSSTTTTANKRTGVVPDKKPEKPALLAHPSESTLKAPGSSSGQTPVVASSSSSVTTPNPEELSSPQGPRIPGSFDGRPSLDKKGSSGKREGLISKFKSLFK
ncbi:hypothetical protein KGF57_001514 [Candida theae]|uniref:AMP-activated protein kinase glycogen-binding domain-containing protein n=1 Tax=Candida theae TaxID=1198502 RepID=A0AAD5FZU0_9ASCO|nr:uncharacterized protein KGF57_001514 [Candida theae]KAI5961975.1 hypothetical protein KGF57_001514 [Candida theae]